VSFEVSAAHKEDATQVASRDADCRCVCGNLVARVVADGVELKCRRCKRKLIVAVSAGCLEHPGSALRVRAAPDAS
jgi:hypothetical protein